MLAAEKPRDDQLNGEICQYFGQPQPWAKLCKTVVVLIMIQHLRPSSMKHIFESFKCFLRVASPSLVIPCTASTTSKATKFTETGYVGRDADEASG